MTSKPRRLHTCKLLTLLSFLYAALPSAAHAADWNGWARCVIDIQGTGYTNYETQTWLVSHATATTPGPADWSVSGNGRHDVGNPAQQSEHAEWAINANVSGGRLLAVVYNNVVTIRPTHAQLRQTNGITGYAQLTISNSPRTPTTIASTAYEYAFPLVQGPATNQTLTGSSVITPTAPWGIRQPYGSAMKVSCQWSFADGMIPPPPPPVPATPPPTPPDTTPPPTSKPPADPCAAVTDRPTFKNRNAQISALIPRVFRQGERVLVCGSNLMKAAMEQKYSDGGRGSGGVMTFVQIGEKNIMAIKPLVSQSGDRIEFTVGGLYERSPRSKIDVLVPVYPVLPEWSGPFLLSVHGETNPTRGPEVTWRP
jgi:hypothetical protein